MITLSRGRHEVFSKERLKTHFDNKHKGHADPERLNEYLKQILCRMGNAKRSFSDYYHGTAIDWVSQLETSFFLNIIKPTV